MATVTVNVTNTDETQSLRNTWKATKYMLACNYSEPLIESM